MTTPTTAQATRDSLLIAYLLAEIEERKNSCASLRKHAASLETQLRNVCQHRDLLTRAVAKSELENTRRATEVRDLRWDLARCRDELAFTLRRLDQARHVLSTVRPYAPVPPDDTWMYTEEALQSMRW